MVRPRQTIVRGWVFNPPLRGIVREIFIIFICAKALVFEKIILRKGGLMVREIVLAERWGRGWEKG
jgi:hypothetical protein